MSLRATSEAISQYNYKIVLKRGDCFVAHAHLHSLAPPARAGVRQVQVSSALDLHSRSLS